MNDRWGLCDLKLAWFLCIHVAIWTLVQVVSKHTVNGDVIEAFNWGSQLSFGYDKNPYLPGFAAAFAKIIFGDSLLACGYYLLQQCCIAAGCWGIYCLGKKMLSPEKAMIGVLVMEGCLYFNAYTSSNNDNYLLIGLTPWSLYFFYRLFPGGSLRYRDWATFGILFGLMFMTKYSALIFGLCLILYALFSAPFRQGLSQRKRQIFLAFMGFSLMFLPNFLWLFSHDFLSLKYLFFRANPEESSRLTLLLGHFGVLNFIWMTLCNIFGVFILFLFARPYRFRSFSEHTRFIIYTGLLPLGVVILIGFLVSPRMYWEWGVPFVLLTGLVLISVFEIRRSFQGVYYAALVLIFLGGALSIAINLEIKPGGSGDFPARAIASYAEKLWEENTPAPFKYIGGSRYLAGYISYYNQSHPLVYSEWNPAYAPSINDCKIKKFGAIFVQDGGYGTTVEALPADYKDPYHFPKAVVQRFPSLKIMGIKTFPYEGKGHQVESVLFGVVPAEGDSVHC